MKRKRTASVEARIRAARAKGASYEELRRKFKLGLATISRALNEPPATKAAGERQPRISEVQPNPAKAPEHPAEAPATAPPSHEELRGWLGEQVAALRADCARYRSEGNASALAAATRSLTAASALLEKATPAPVTKEAGVFVTAESAQADAQRGEEWLAQLVRDLHFGSENWPRCATCGQGIAPDDLEERIARMGNGEST